MKYFDILHPYAATEHYFTDHAILQPFRKIYKYHRRTKSIYYEIEWAYILPNLFVPILSIIP